MIAVANLSRASEARWNGTLGTRAEPELLRTEAGPILISIGAVFARRATGQDMTHPQIASR